MRYSRLLLSLFRPWKSRALLSERGAGLIFLGLSLGAAGCAANKDTLQIPARILYFQAESFENDELYSEARARYQSVIDENPGTRLATYAHLKMGDLNSKLGQWSEAETSYRLFLLSNPISPMTRYVLYRLLLVNHENSYTGAIFREREIDRDVSPNRRIILEFKRFSLLYPDSVYMGEIRPIYHAARETLAEYELMVGDYYFSNEHFNAAVHRYMFLLRNFPEYRDIRGVVNKLIQAYRKNQQPEDAAEMQRVYDALPPSGQESSVDTERGESDSVAESGNAGATQPNQP